MPNRLVAYLHGVQVVGGSIRIARGRPIASHYAEPKR
jgi:hypothetical protein